MVGREGIEVTPGRESLAFYETLVVLLPPRTVGDRVCFRRVADWLREGVRDGRFTTEIYERVLLYAQESSMPGSRKPHAVFMSILKKELGYGSPRVREPGEEG